MQPLFSVFNTRYLCLPYNVLVLSLLTLECLALKCRQCLNILREVHYQYLAQLALLTRRLQFSAFSRSARDLLTWSVFLGRHVLKVVIPFPTTYKWKSAFSALLTIKLKARNRLDTIHDMRDVLFKAEPKPN